MSEPRGKKRKKRSFLSKARHHGKKGRFGRGSIVEEDTYQYFVRVWEVKKNGFECDEDKRVFVKNVFAQLSGKEVEYSCNQLVSRVVEELLPDAPEEDQKEFMEAFIKDLRPIATDPFASHVLEQLVRISGKNKKDCSFALKVSKFLFNNIEEFLWDKYANQVSRTALTTLSQCEAPEASEALNKITLKSLKWPNFNELPFYELTSGLLQSILTSAKNLEGVSEHIVDALLSTFEKTDVPIKQEDGVKAEDFPPVLSSVPSTRLLESCIETERSLTRVFDSFFEGRVSQVAQSKNANLALQKLISTNKDEALFDRIFQSLKGEVGAILESGNSGVIHKLTQACLLFTSKQGDMMKSLEGAFGCAEKGKEREFFQRVLTLTPKGSYESKTTSLHGSLILQCLLKFKKPIKIINGLLDLGGEALKVMLCDPRGSHLADALIDSEYVGEKSRERLVKTLKGHYVDLAKCKFGSRAFEKVWSRANVKSRLEIGRELLKGEASLGSTKFGPIVASNISLHLLRTEPDKWKSLQTNPRTDPKDLFKDIISPQ